MKGKTWSRGSNSSLPFGVNVILNLSTASSFAATFGSLLLRVSQSLLDLLR